MITRIYQKGSSQPFSLVPTRHVCVSCRVLFVPFPVLFLACVGHV